MCVLHAIVYCNRNNDQVQAGASEVSPLLVAINDAVLTNQRMLDILHIFSI